MPPALTKGIKALEADFGAPLVFREGRRILVSDFGHSMLPHLRTIADEAAATQALAETFRLLEQVPIRLEMISTIGHLRLARSLSGFEREHPGIELAPSEVTPAEIIDRLLDGELDVGVLTWSEDMPERLNTTDLYLECYVVEFPPDHRFGRSNAVAPSNLSREHCVDRTAYEMREMVMGVCADRGAELYAGSARSGRTECRRWSWQGLALPSCRNSRSLCPGYCSAP